MKTILGKQPLLLISISKKPEKKNRYFQLPEKMDTNSYVSQAPRILNQPLICKLLLASKGYCNLQDIWVVGLRDY